MKRLFLSVLILLVSISLFSSPTVYNGITDKPYRADTFRFKAMGKAGLAIPKRQEPFFINAAGLADDRTFYLDIPNISLSIYHVKTLLTAPYGKIMDGDVEAILATVNDFKGATPFVRADEGISFSFRSFGASVDIRETLYTYGDSIGTGFIPALNSALSFGWGHRWTAGNNVDLDFGIMGHLSGVWYSTDISIESALSLILGSNDAISLVSGSWSATMDLGFIATFDNGFSLGATVNNIGGCIFLLDTTENKTESIFTPVYANIGVGWSKTIKKWFSLGLAADLVNIEELFSPDFRFSYLPYYINLGAELNFSTWFAIYLGLDGGYPSCGLKLQLLNLRLTALYRIEEFGSEVGLNPVDSLEVGLTLAF